MSMLSMQSWRPTNLSLSSKQRFHPQKKREGGQKRNKKKKETKSTVGRLHEFNQQHKMSGY